MQAAQTNRIHPLMAGAAASVMLVSLVGVAAITGLLPSSRGNEAEARPAGVMPAQQMQAQGPAAAAPLHAAQLAASEPAPQKPPVREVVRQKTVVHHQYVQQAAAPQQPARVAQPQYHPVGIATGAVVGGLIGSQVGGGNGKTLATIAGAVGGGYVGNEVAKRY